MLQAECSTPSGRCSSVVERTIGNGEAGSSILPSGTTILIKSLYFNELGEYGAYCIVRVLHSGVT